MTTSKDLDEIREKFTFSIKAVMAYHLGKAQHGSLPEPTIPRDGDKDDLAEKSDASLFGDVVEGGTRDQYIDCFCCICLRTSTIYLLFSTTPVTHLQYVFYTNRTSK